MHVRLGLGAQGTAAIAQEVVASIGGPEADPLAAQDRTLAGDHLRRPAEFILRDVMHPAHISASLTVSDVDRVPIKERHELIAPRGFLAGAYDVHADEVLVEDQKLRDEHRVVSPKLGDPPDPPSSHPPRRSLHESLVPGGQMFGGDTPPSPQLAVQGHKRVGGSLGLLRTGRLAPEPVLLGAPQRPARRFAQLPAQGGEQLLPRVGTHQDVVCYGDAGLGSPPSAEESPSSGFWHQLLEVSHPPAVQLREGSCPSTRDRLLPAIPHQHVLVWSYYVTI